MLIDAAFDLGCGSFSDQGHKSKLRIRDYEGVLRKGFLGKEAVAFTKRCRSPIRA